MFLVRVSSANPVPSGSSSSRAAGIRSRFPLVRIVIAAPLVGAGLPAILLMFLLALASQATAADEPLFSGPQTGEKLPPLQARGVYGPLEGKEFDPVADAAGKPLILIFVHARTRPAFALTNAVMRYAASRTADGLKSAIVFLPEDATETAEWLKRVQQYFPEKVSVGIATDGLEGPGAYGLNRNVTLTVLVGNEGKVAANFALVDPSLQVDGPKIAAQIVKVLGGGKVPTAEELAGNAGAGRAMQLGDPKAEQLLRGLLRPDASPDDVKQAAEKLQEYLAANERVRAAVMRTARQLVESGRLKNLGSPAAREWIEKWSKPAAGEERR